MSRKPKGSILIFLSSSTIVPKRESFLQNRFPGEGVLIFRLCLSYHVEWVFYINTLLVADAVSSKTHCGFECPYGYSCSPLLNHMGTVLQRRVSRNRCGDGSKDDANCKRDHSLVVIRASVWEQIIQDLMALCF
jgi:hypothetical protein